MRPSHNETRQSQLHRFANDTEFRLEWLRQHGLYTFSMTLAFAVCLGIALAL